MANELSEDPKKKYIRKPIHPLVICEYQTRPHHIDKRQVFYLDYCAGYLHDHLSLNIILRGGVKNRYFTVRLTVSVPPHTLRSAFLDFLGVSFTLYYDHMCSDLDFTHPTTKIPSSSSG